MTQQEQQQLRYRILDQFGQVSTADLDTATDIEDRNWSGICLILG